LLRKAAFDAVLHLSQPTRKAVQIMRLQSGSWKQIELLNDSAHIPAIN
jgi:hypothetical protein